LQGVDELLPELLILEVTLVHIVEDFPAYSVNASRSCAVIV